MTEQLRQVDWRFLLHTTRKPRCLELSKGKASEALALVTESVERDDGEADLAVLGYPTARALAVARSALRDGGEVACLWRGLRPAGLRRARGRLEAAGFEQVRFYRPGPLPSRQPELWLPLDAPAARERALAERPPRSRREALLRRAWLRFGPVCALARRPGTPASTGEGTDELPDPEAWVLLTGGAESDAKVVGIPHFAGQESAEAIAKFARVAKADLALEREAEHLDRLARERSGLAGVPRLRARGRRVGQVGIVQDTVPGKPLNTAMSAEAFAVSAPVVTRWLAALAESPEPQPSSAWAERLVAEPLAELRRLSQGATELTERAARALGSLGDLPLVWEHRDFGPWNIFLAADGAPAVIDWEDAEPRGLPGLDLAYFLASAAFATGDGLDPSRRVEDARERNARLLDPSTELGKAAAACVEDYCATVGVSAADFQRLRLLCWLVQALIAARRTAEEPAAPAAADLAVFLALAEDELNRLEGQP